MNLYIDTTQDNFGANKYTNPKDTILQIEPEIKGKTPVLGKIESSEFSNITINAKNMDYLGEQAQAETAFVSYGGLQMPDQKIINNVSQRSDQNINQYQIAMSSSKIKEVIDQPLVELLNRRQIDQLEFGPQYIYRNQKELNSEAYHIVNSQRTPLCIFPSVSNPQYYVTSFKITQLFDLLGIEYNKSKFTNPDDPLFGAYFNIPVNTMRDDIAPDRYIAPGASNSELTNWYNLKVWSRLTYQTVDNVTTTILDVRSEGSIVEANLDSPLKGVFLSCYQYGDNFDRTNNFSEFCQQQYTYGEWDPDINATHYAQDRYQVTLNLPNNKRIVNHGLLILDDMDIQYSQNLYQLLQNFYVTTCQIGYNTSINNGEVSDTEHFLNNFCGLKEVKFLGDYGFDKDGRATTDPQQPDESIQPIQQWEDLPPLHIDAGSMLCFWPKDMINGRSLVWRSSWESTPPSFSRVSFGVSNTIMTNPHKKSILTGITLRDVLNVLNYHSCGKLTITANMGVVDVNCFEYKLMNMKYPASIHTLDVNTAQNYKISPTHIQSTTDQNYLGGSSLAYTLADSDMIDDCRNWLNNIGNWQQIYQSGIWGLNGYNLRWLTRFENKSSFTYIDKTSKLSPAKSVDICKAPYCIFYIQQMCQGVFGFRVLSGDDANTEVNWTNYESSALNFAYEIKTKINPSQLPLINNYYIQDYEYVGSTPDQMYPGFLMNVITDYNYKNGEATMKVLSNAPVFNYIEAP